MRRPLSPFAERLISTDRELRIVMRARRWTLLLVAGLFVTPSYVRAQTLTPKRVLTIGAAPGCPIVPPGQATVARRDNAEARRLAAAGQEAALIGDQSAARDAFARAAVLNPGDERVAYDLARAHEELADSVKAVTEYCRYLTLSPTGRESADVRARLTQLVPRPAQQRAQDVQVAFRLGLALFDDGRYDASVRAFDDVIKNAPTSAEGYFNRGLAYAATGKRTDALKDLEQYRAAAPTVDDRVEVGRAIETLRRPVFGPGMAFARGVLPGFGQFYTGRPVRGVVLLVAVAGSAGFALAQTTTEKVIPYTDPNGVPAPYTQTTTDRPYFAPAMAAAVGLTIVGAVEAMLYASRSQRGASIVPRRGGGTASSVDVAPWADRAGRVGLQVSTRF
ncbi:MAG: tetratricopeptide repeat protein [Gemmatimonas sp.]